MSKVPQVPVKQTVTFQETRGRPPTRRGDVDTGSRQVPTPDSEVYTMEQLLAIGEAARAEGDEVLRQTREKHRQKAQELKEHLAKRGIYEVGKGLPKRDPPPRRSIDDAIDRHNAYFASHDVPFEDHKVPVEFALRALPPECDVNLDSYIQSRKGGRGDTCSDAATLVEDAETVMPTEELNTTDRSPSPEKPARSTRNRL